MGIEQIDESLIAGARAENADVHASAAINPIKFEKRPFYLPLHIGNILVTGGIVTQPVSGIAILLRFPSGSAESMYLMARAPRGEVVNGEIVKLHVFWETAATSGIARLVAEIRPALDGAANLSSAIQRSMLSDVPSGANTLQEIIFEFPPAIFSQNHIIAVKLTRDPGNVLDTLADNMDIAACFLEIPGRC